MPDGSGTQTTATAAGLHFERNQFGEVCAGFSVTVHGSFQYWTGAESVTMTQDPPAQRPPRDALGAVSCHRSSHGRRGGAW